MERTRTRSPDVRIAFRGDCGFAAPAMDAARERFGVEYMIGLGANAALNRIAADLQKDAERKFKETGDKQRLLQTFEYRAKTRPAARTTIVKAEHRAGGANYRFIVTYRPGAAQVPEAAYDDYVQRGEAENRNKEKRPASAVTGSPTIASWRISFGCTCTPRRTT